MGQVVKFEPKTNIMDEAEKLVEAIDRFHFASLALGTELAQRRQSGEKLTEAEEKFLLHSVEYAQKVQGFGARK